MTSEQFNQLMAGMKSAENAKAEEFDPMKGRTYISRLSPEANKALAEALKKKRKKNTAKRAEKKMSERKKASDDYFAGEADKAMDMQAKEDMSNQIEERLLKDRGDAMIDKYKRGGKTKKYRR